MGTTGQIHDDADSRRRCVLVIGAGIAGASVAQRLSQAGPKVHLIEKAPAIGGHVAEMGCKATDVCLRCNVCVASELFRTVNTSGNIHLHTRTQLVQLQPGRNGSRYTATLKHEATFIDADLCMCCRACVSACPQKCIRVPKVTAQSGVPVVDYASCRRATGQECSACEQSCPVGAIDMAQQNHDSVIDVDSVVVAVGHEPYDPAENASYGYAGTANVITGIEAERQLADDHTITRPSDGQSPKRIGFVQCVGSRSEEVHRRPEDTDYCSAVCCAYALRTAQLIKHQNSDVEITIFYMDVQKFGKGFEQFYQQCKDNVTFIRSRPYEIKHNQDGTVCVRYAPPALGDELGGQVCEQQFDLVILSVGIRPSTDTTKLAETLLTPLDEQGFFGLKGAEALPGLQREGIYAAGTCESPKDIESCIAQAQAVSAAILSEVKQVVR